MRVQPFDNVRGAESPHFWRTQGLGYTCVNLMDTECLPIGAHIVRGVRTCYLKYKDNVLYRRLHGHSVADIYAYCLREYHYLEARSRETGNPDYRGGPGGATRPVTASG